MRTVLYVTLETLRIAAILLQPAMPSAMAKLLDLLAVPADRRAFAEIEAGPIDGAKRLQPGVALPPPAAIFPRYAEA